MKSEEFSFNLFNTDFYGKRWDATDSKAVIVLVHGLGEYVSRYERNVIPKLVENGFSVVGYDQFGHGKTTGKVGYCPSYDAVLECLTFVVSKAKDMFSEKDIFLYGHSMGGNVVINSVLRKKINIKGVVASSPFLKLAFNPPTWKVKVALLLRKLYPKTTLRNGVNPNYISRVPEEILLYKNDVEIHNKVSYNYSIEFIDSGDWAIENAATLKVPMLLVHGTNDKIISVNGAKMFSNNTDLATLNLYEGGYHELHNDLCKEVVLNDIVAWLKEQIKNKDV